MQDADAFQIRSELTVPLNLEMAVTEEMLGIALRLKPEFVCLVPENRQEITTEGGLDVLGSLRKIHDVVARLRDAGIRVSVFIDPELRQVDAAIEVGADMIELHTGAFANATGVAEKIELDRLTVAATHAHPSLQVNAGHGINFTNISQILTIPYLAELNIGHSIIARATRVGLTVAVREMKEAMTHYLA
jgi:pyridoxine 5-phosphate synthase